jgi:hypothetical protein
MKIAKTIFAALFLVSNIAASSMAPADDGVIEKPWLRAVIAIRSSAQSTRAH